MVHWLERIQKCRWKQTAAAATGKSSAGGKPTTPASLIAGSKAGKQLAVESRELTDSIRNIGVIAHIDAGRITMVRPGADPVFRGCP